MLTIGSLFSGIGGLDLGLERSGIGRVVWQVEKDTLCQKVLAKHWPNVERFDDVTTVRNLPHVDLICGGFPCQDVSSAGKRRGIGGKQSGLWYYFAKHVQQIKPRFVVVENVSSGAKKWLPHARHQLHVFGYRTRALGIAASDVGAPHRRNRTFVLAYAFRHSVRIERGGCSGAHGQGSSKPGYAGQDAPYAHGHREHVVSVDAEVGQSSGHLTGEHWRQPEPPMVRMVPRISSRMDRRRALGNAVVPQCAEVVGMVIRQMLETT